MMRAADEEETYMAVLLLWAVPAVIVVGGVGYYLVHAVHQVKLPEGGKALVGTPAGLF
jgi:hypothetical protein